VCCFGVWNVCDVSLEGREGYSCEKVVSEHLSRLSQKVTNFLVSVGTERMSQCGGIERTGSPKHPPLLLPPVSFNLLPDTVLF
jgi:hypothetical protein